MIQTSALVDGCYELLLDGKPEAAQALAFGVGDYLIASWILSQADLRYTGAVAQHTDSAIAELEATT